MPCLFHTGVVAGGGGGMSLMRADLLETIAGRYRGLLIQGCREWTDYRVDADCTPHLARAAGLAARVQGMGRYYALVLWKPDRLRLVKVLDGEILLAEAVFPWQLGATYRLSLIVQGSRVQAEINDQLLFDVTDETNPLTGGAAALVVEEGRMAAQKVQIGPIQ